MIADVAFDAPVDHPFSYRVPPGWSLRAGQRVLAPLGGARRVGIVLAVREGDESALKPLLEIADATPALTGAGIELVRWIAGESLSSVGSTSAALLPPILDDKPARRSAGNRGGRKSAAEVAPRAPHESPAVASGRGAPATMIPPPRATVAGSAANGVELLIGA